MKSVTTFLLHTPLLLLRNCSHSSFSLFPTPHHTICCPLFISLSPTFLFKVLYIKEMVRHHISNEDDYHDVYGVIVEWYDPQAQLLRQYVLKVRFNPSFPYLIVFLSPYSNPPSQFFNKSHEVEMVDNKSRKLFLRRTACPEHVTLKDLYVGNRINIFGR